MSRSLFKTYFLNENELMNLQIMKWIYYVEIFKKNKIQTNGKDIINKNQQKIKKKENKVPGTNII